MPRQLFFAYFSGVDASPGRKNDRFPTVGDDALIAPPPRCHGQAPPGVRRKRPGDEVFPDSKKQIPEWICSNSQPRHLFDPCPHPYRMRPQIKGLSHGLKKCPPDTFLPALRSGRPFESPGVAKKQIPEWVSAFLVRRKGLEPPTLGTGIRCSIH